MGDAPDPDHPDPPGAHHSDPSGGAHPDPSGGARPDDVAGLLGALDDLVGPDPGAALVLARDLAARAVVAGDPVAAWTARTREAEALQRLGETSAAAALVAEVRACGVPLSTEAVVRASWVLARIFTDVGDHVTALEHVLEAAGALDDTVPLRTRVRVLIKAGDVLDELGSLDEARTWYARAEELATGDGQLHMLVVNNLAYSEFLSCHPAEAQAAADRLVELGQRYDRPLNANSLDTVARIHLMRGEDAVAAEVARTAVAANAAMDSKNADDLPVLLLTLAVATRRLGDLAGAEQALEQAQALLDDDAGFGDLRADLLQERAELLAQRGDHAAAFVTHKAFHAADKELLSLRREAQARARQALYETQAARREADVFREQARRDPLTGLRNRLYVDEVLPRLVAGAVTHGDPLAVALLDLDHFKSVNDTFSHEVGDEVLRLVARRLEAAVPHAGPGGFVARLGGEEFVLVMATGPGRALAVVEDVRVGLQEHDWSATTPGRRLTVSAGVSVASGSCTKETLLARADELLYRAKAAGRNRVLAETIVCA